MTDAMLRVGASVLAVEFDRDLARALSERLGANPQFTLRQADALVFDFAQALRDDPRRGRARVVANIPYYITTPLILRLVNRRDLFEAAFLTVQREVAERICAGPGDMTLLALSVQVYGQPRVAATIPAGAFYPPPKVDSAVVRIEIAPEPRQRGERLWHARRGRSPNVRHRHQRGHVRRRNTGNQPEVLL